MTLTKEEREKIEDEERVRAEARAKFSKPQEVKIKKKTSLATWGCLILIIIFYISYLSIKNTDNLSPQPYQPLRVSTTSKKINSNEGGGISISVPVGQNGFLRISGQKEVLVATTKENQDKLIEAAVANDTYGIAEMVYNGEVFGVPNGTKVLVVDKKFAVSKIRILEGEGVGKIGWVPYEFVSPK